MDLKPQATATPGQQAVPRLNEEPSNRHLARCTAVLERPIEPAKSELLALEQDAIRSCPALAMPALHRELARQLAADHSARLRSGIWPDDIAAAFTAERTRIESEIQRKPDAHFSFANYRFKADMRILCLRRIPAGMYDLELSAIPKRILGTQGAGGAWRLLRVVTRAGGFSPFFTQHLAPHRMKLFTPSERNRFLGRVAALLQQRPEIRGLISTAWYNDPAVSNFSPQLAYLRDGWERWGQGVFRIGTSADVRHDATAFSFERRRLVEAGSYLPTAYLGIALRTQLMQLTSRAGTVDGH